MDLGDYSVIDFSVVLPLSEDNLSITRLLERQTEDYAIQRPTTIKFIVKTAEQGYSATVLLD